MDQLCTFFVLLFDFALVPPEEALRILLQIFVEDAIRADFHLHLPIRATTNADANRAAGAVPGQTQHTHVVQEILAAELRADAWELTILKLTSKLIL